MHEALVKEELERRFYGYGLADIHVEEFKDGKVWADFLLGTKRCRAELSISQGSAYILRGPQDDFYNEYPLIKKDVDPKFDFNVCCQRAFRLSNHNGQITGLTLVKRWEAQSRIEFKCKACGTRLWFDQKNGGAPWSKIL